MRKIKGQSIRELLGIKAFSSYGLEVNKEQNVYFSVSPTNISVLSKENVENKIRHLMNVIQALPEIEIVCTDSSQCFDANLVYLKEREENEENESIKDLLRQDRVFLDDIQRETANARSFYLIFKCKNIKDEQIFSYINRCEKIISDQGFEIKRMQKPDIKKMLGIYFDMAARAEDMPDIDGLQYFDLKGETKVAD